MDDFPVALAQPLTAFLPAGCLRDDRFMAAAAWDTYAVAMDYLRATGEHAKARAWAARAAKCAAAALGEDSEEYLRYVSGWGSRER